MSVLMLIHSVQTSLYVFAACLYLNMKCADCRLKPCLPCQEVQREGRVLPLPSTWPRGSDTHPAQAGLGSTWGQEASCSAFHVVWEGISQREGPARVPLATDANQGKGSFGENCCRAPSCSQWEHCGRPPSKGARAVWVWHGKSPGPSCCASSAELPLARVLCLQPWCSLRMVPMAAAHLTHIWEQRAPVCTGALPSEELWERIRCSFLAL